MESISCGNNKRTAREKIGINFSQNNNNSTDLDACLLPSLSKIVNAIAQIAYIDLMSVIDLMSAYRQVPLRIIDKKYTAF